MALGVELAPAPPALQPRLAVTAPGQLEHLQERSNIAQCNSTDLITAYVEVAGGRVELQHLKHGLSSNLGWMDHQPPPNVVAHLVDHVADQVQAGLLAWTDCLVQFKSLYNSTIYT